MIEDIIKVSIITAILALDTKLVGNFQISLPVISCPLLALILCNGVDYNGIYTGFFIGGFITLLWLNLLPIGTTVLPDSTVAGSIAISLSLLLPRITQIDMKIAVVISIIIGVSFGFISKWIEIHLREFNTYLSESAIIYSSRGNIAMINVLNLLAVFLEALKSFIVSFVGIYFCINILPRIIPTLPAEIINGIKNTYFLLFCIGFANILYIFITRKFITHFLVSFLSAFILLNIFKFSNYKLLVSSLLLGTIISFIPVIYRDIRKVRV